MALFPLARNIPAGGMSAEGPPKRGEFGRHRPGRRPAGGATHSSTELANSGMLFNPLVGPPGAPGTYSLKFEETGSEERPDMVGTLFFVDICWSGILRLLYGTCS